MPNNGRMSASATGGSRAGTSPHISVLVCSFNPRPDYLTRVLRSLAAQTLPKDQWELLLVDNASDPPLAGSWELSWHPRGRVIREEQLGLTAARARGIKEAAGTLLVFVDDDNVLPSNYLAQVLELTRQYPHVSVFGAGVLEPEFEITPPSELSPVLQLLALRNEAAPLWSNNVNDSRCIAWGAGLCVRCSTAAAYLELIGQLTIWNVLDRRGTDLNCGGDDLFSWVSVWTGCGFGVFPGLRITHLIRAERLTEDYIVRLRYAHAYSHGILRYVVFGEQPSALSLAKAIQIVLHGIYRGRFSMRCLWAMARGTRAARRYLRDSGIRPVKDLTLAGSHPY
jgi:glycosyltransferase involved in cell wall biosynthesis